jgi:hypothetical protein
LHLLVNTGCLELVRPRFMAANSAKSALGHLQTLRSALSISALRSKVDVL